MSDRSTDCSPRSSGANDRVEGARAGASRRTFLKSGAGVVAGGAFAAAGAPAAAQPSDAELARVSGARRILIKGAVVLSLDRQVGDFAAADILIEDGRIREVRPNIVAADDTAAVIDGGNRIVIPGFVDTHSHSYQGVLRSIMPNGVLEPDYNRDFQTKLTPPFAPEGCFARVLMAAPRLHEQGTPPDRDVSQISHTPE